jgi:hypothetical protein
MLQNTKDLFEPDAAAIAAIQAFRPGASISAIRDRGQLLRAEVRRQLSLYHKEMLAVSRRRRNTMAADANLDSAGLDVKQAQGRLPKDLTLLTAMMTRLWNQVFEPVWTGVIEPWLQAQKKESSVQSYLLCENFEGFTHFAEDQGLTKQDVKNLRALLQLELSFLRSQVWGSSLVSEFHLTEHEGCKLYEFRTSRSFKTAGKPAPGSLPAATRWPLSIKTSALVHILLHLTSASNYVFPGTSRRAVSQAASKTFAQLGYNWCGIPRLGAHAFRTYQCCKAVSNPDIGVQDYPALASRMQVSVDTMVSVYAAQSMKGPVAQLAFKLHASAEKENSLCEQFSKKEKQQEKEEQQQEQAPKKEQGQEQHRKRQKLEHHHHHHQQHKQQQEQQLFQQQYLFQQQQVFQQQHVFQQQLLQQQLFQQQHHLLPMPWLQSVTSPMPAPAPETAPVPYGRALSTLRHKHDHAIKGHFESLGFCVKFVLKRLVWQQCFKNSVE